MEMERKLGVVQQEQTKKPDWTKVTKRAYTETKIWLKLTEYCRNSNSKGSSQSYYDIGRAKALNKGSYTHSKFL